MQAPATARAATGPGAGAAVRAADRVADACNLAEDEKGVGERGRCTCGREHPPERRRSHTAKCNVLLREVRRAEHEASHQAHCHLRIVWLRERRRHQQCPQQLTAVHGLLKRHEGLC